MIDDSLKKFLGIKEVSWAYALLQKIKKKISLKFIIIFLIVVLLVAFYFSFAYYEYILHPETIEEISVDEVSPYFLSFFWLIGTLLAGYAEAPYSTVGRILDLLLIIIGITTIATIISQITSRVVSANIGSMFGKSYTKKKMDIIVCGWNPITESAIEELKKEYEDIVIIDKEDIAEIAKANKIMFINGAPIKSSVLEKANIKHAKNIILALKSDSETLLCIHIVRELNPYINIIVKIDNYEHIELAKRAGADHVVSPSSIGGRLLSIVADEPHVVDWVISATTSKKGLELVEYVIGQDSPYLNKTIGQIMAEIKPNAKILGIETPSGFEKIPTDETKVEQGSKLILIQRKVQK